MKISIAVIIILALFFVAVGEKSYIAMLPAAGILIFIVALFPSIKRYFKFLFGTHVQDLGEIEFADDPADEAESVTPEPVLPEFRKYNGYGYLAYKYDDVRFTLVTADVPATMIYKPVEFVRESDGISVKCESRTIGRLIPHKITDMISDWLDREESCVAYLTSKNYATMEGSFIIGFYRDELAYAQRKYDEYKEFKLVGNRSGEIAETVAFTNEGERCSVDYDPAHDKYAVYDDLANIIGYLPSAGAKYFEEHDEDCVSVVSRAEYDEDYSHRILYVTLFAKN